MQPWDVNYGLMVAKVKLVAQDQVLNGYSTYVFECLDQELKDQTKYIMTTRFPNWDHRPLKIDEIGYLHFEERKAGKDTWYDINTNLHYSFNYDIIQFIKFIEIPKTEDNKYIM